jgi:hypothetical protein
MAGPVLLLLLFGGVVAMLLAWTAGVNAEHERRVNARLAQIASQLGGQAGSNAAVGRHGGVPVTYRFASRGAGSTSESWTEIDVDVPQAYPLELHLRRHLRSDFPQIERGEMIDVQLGDPAFDPEFLVEAAPADVARILLDRDARCYLATHAAVQLDTTTVDGRRVLRLAFVGWREDLVEAMAAIGVVTRIASRVRDAFAAVSATGPVRDVGTPYRPLLDDSAVHDADAARLREARHVEQVREARTAAELARTRVLIASLLFVCIGLPVLIVIAAR